MKPSFQQLLDQILQADERALPEVIERNLTRLDDDFDGWLQERIGGTNPDQSDRLEAVHQAIKHFRLYGNYRRAEFDETSPENAKEILLALARRIERGEETLSAAVEQAVDALVRAEGVDLLPVWGEFSTSLTENPAMKDYVALGELMYQAAKRLPELLAMLSHFELPVRAAVLNTGRAAASGLRRQGRVEEALRLYERMVAIAQECGDFNNYCGGLFTLGDVWRDHLPASDHPDHLIRAEEYYARALKVCEEFRLAPDLRAEILLELGRAVVWQGRIAEGVARLEECLAYCRQSGLERTMTSFRSRLDLVDACWDAGDRVSAAHHLRDAFALARDREAGIDVSISLLESMAARLSSLAHLIGAKVGEGLAEAERLAEEKAGDPAACKLRSTIYAAVGIFCTQAGEWQRALDAYQMAIEEARACGDERAADRWLDNQAKVYLQLGQQTDAERMLKQTLPAHQRRDDLQGQANQLLDYGHIFLREKQPVRAANHAAQCFALFHRLEQPNGMLAAVLLLGEAFRAMGDLRKAEASLHYCREKAESVGAMRLQFYVLDKLAEIELEQGATEKADATWASATRLAAELGEMAEQEFRVKRGKLLQSLSRPDEAEAEYRRAISQFETVRGEFRSAERRMQAQSRLQEAYALLLTLLAETKGNRTEAFDLSERARSRTLAELLSRREVRQPASLPRELAGREWRLLSELSRLEDPSQSGVALARRHAALIRELEELWRTMAAIDEDCRAYADLRRDPRTDFAELTGLLVI